MIRTRVVVCVGWIPTLLIVGSIAVAQTKSPLENSTPTKAERVLEQSAEEGKFTFLVFYKSDTPAVREVAKVAKEGVAKRSDKAAVAFVQITDPAEKAIVAKFDVARSPMPLTLVVAPNGAITGAFPKELRDENLDAAIVTPTMIRVMKSLQENRLVFVCVQATDSPTPPPAVKQMRADPEFKDRIVVVSMELDDPEESRFVQQMQIDPGKVRGNVAALLAPPGVLIGKFHEGSTKNEVAEALHKAGKCCDDANCKHNSGSTAKSPAKTRKR